MPFDRATYWKEYRKKNAGKWSLKRSPITKKPVKINKVSAKRAKELRVYEKEKAAFFETVEHCEFPGCEVTNISLHHAKGRIGDNLTDRRYFKALCWVHHQWAEENPTAAKEMGLSVSRLDKAG